MNVKYKDRQEVNDGRNDAPLHVLGAQVVSEFFHLLQDRQALRDAGARSEEGRVGVKEALLCQTRSIG